MQGLTSKQKDEIQVYWKNQNASSVFISSRSLILDFSGYNSHVMIKSSFFVLKYNQWSKFYKPKSYLIAVAGHFNSLQEKNNNLESRRGKRDSKLQQIKDTIKNIFSQNSIYITPKYH